jgi:hypothetical protein
MARSAIFLAFIPTKSLRPCSVTHHEKLDVNLSGHLKDWDAQVLDILHNQKEFQASKRKLGEKTKGLGPSLQNHLTRLCLILFSPKEYKKLNDDDKLKQVVPLLKGGSFIKHEL